MTLGCLAGTKPPLESQSIDLVIHINGERIGGTLTIPDNRKEKSLVIMSSGSGPQDRDETLYDFKIFKVIAEHLASKGIASFRYDDRGVGGSTGDFANSTMEDLSRDLEGIMDHFKSAKIHSFQDFILFGHSQGGILAAHVAERNDAVKNVILMGAPAVPLVEVVLYQVRHEYEQSKISGSLIEAHVSAHNKLMRAISDNQHIDQAHLLLSQTTESILLKLDSGEDERDIQNIRQQAGARADQLQIVYGLPSLASFLYHDPSKDYERLKVPVLGLFGGLDSQVPIYQNKDRMENALLKSGAAYHLITFDKANHFFQEATTGNSEEYPMLAKKFVDNFLDEISNWILAN